MQEDVDHSVKAKLRWATEAFLDALLSLVYKPQLYFIVLRLLILRHLSENRPIRLYTWNSGTTTNYSLTSAEPGDCIFIHFTLWRVSPSTHATMLTFRQIDQLPRYAPRQLSKRPSFQAMIAPLNPELVMFPVYDTGPCTSMTTITLSVTPGGKYRE